MGLDPQTQGDARTKKHAHLCNGYLPTELASEQERKMGCAECCDCWCHFTFTNPDGNRSGRRLSAYALRFADWTRKVGSSSKCERIAS
jgi:hypothetical protein